MKNLTLTKLFSMKNLTLTKLFSILLLITLAVSADDNIITMEQTGDTFQVGIDQFGHSNEINMLDSNSYISAASLDMYLVQVNTSHTALPNRITFDEISGTGNQMKLGQGIDWTDITSDTNLAWSYDGWEGGGHEVDIAMYGDYNKLAVQQTNQSTALDGHNFDLHLAGDNNETAGKKSVMGALTLYLDFILMFQFLLMFLGNRE